MTSSLPNFAAAPASAGAAPVNAASLPELGAAGTKPPAGDFADFLPTTEAAAECPATATATPSFTVLAPAFFTLLAPAADPAELAAMPELLAAEAATPPPSERVSRDVMEQAASLLATLVQTLLPPATAPEPAPVSPDTTVPTVVRGDANLPSAGTLLADAQPGGMATTNQSTAADRAPAVAAAGTTAETATAGDMTPANASYSFEAHLAADGAVEINATLPASKEQGSARGSAAVTAVTRGPLEIQAELILPGQAVVRLSAAEAPVSEFHARANFAGKNVAAKFAAHPAPDGVERNFVLTGKEELATEQSEAGIAVAKTEATMKTTPTEETRATSNLDNILGLPARGEFTVAWPSADRHSAPPTVSYEMNFAQRAVATVSNLVDTQFNASMQKSGSVRLRLKFGGEDLSVRVELRDGAVHTDFRTDSPELRAALHREWQAVASQSTDALRRYAEPVFSPSANGDSSNPFSGRQQQPAQQDLSQQQPRSPRAAEDDAFTFTRRSLVGEHFAPQPAPSRVPAALPTSLRLSVLA
jgi:hypothetical protein